MRLLLRLVSVIGLVMACSVSACGGGSDSSSESTGSGTDNGTGGDTGKDPNGDGTDPTGTCNTTDPGGRTCGAPADCKVQCECSEGKVSAGSCSGSVTTCSSAADVCPSACETMSLGSYSGKFCAEGGDASEPTTDGKEYGEACERHADCEGWTGDIETSTVHCITYCDHKFCSYDCDGSCSGLSTCDSILESCIPDRYDDCG